MRSIRYDELKEAARRRAAEVRLRAGMDSRKDQPHDDEQWAAQLRADRARRDHWLATGVLVYLGPRRMRLRL